MAQTTTLTNRLRDAVALVRGNPSAVAEIDAADQRKRDEAAAEAKRIATAKAKVDAALESLADQLIEEYVAREQEALRHAALTVARNQLNIKHGLTPPQVVAVSGGAGLKLTHGQVERARSRLDTEQPLPEVARKAIQAAAPPDLLEQRRQERIQEIATINERKRQLEANRQAEIAERKRKLNLAPKKAS